MSQNYPVRSGKLLVRRHCLVAVPSSSSSLALLLQQQLQQSHSLVYFQPFSAKKFDYGQDIYGNGSNVQLPDSLFRFPGVLPQELQSPEPGLKKVNRLRCLAFSSRLTNVLLCV